MGAGKRVLHQAPCQGFSSSDRSGRPGARRAATGPAPFASPPGRPGGADAPRPRRGRNGAGGCCYSGSSLSSQAIIFDVQRFSVDDGPGLRTTVFFKGCPLRCAWCQNPESWRPRPELAFHAERCRRDGRCAAACPADALDLAAPHPLRRERCDACGRCAAACPYGAWEVVGRAVPVAALVEEAARDAPFFEASGGGVTLSGGEPTLQPEAMGALARGLVERGVSVGLQTCGLFAFDALAPHLPLLAFVHFDLKLLAPAAHERHTGAGNARILENAGRLVRLGAPVQFRTPVVPGVTDGDENLDALAGFLRGLGAPRLRLLRYHRLGEAKRARLGDRPPPGPAAGADESERALARAAARLRAGGLEVLA